MAEGGETRTIRTEALARVEGEGAMQIRIRDDEVEDVQLQIYEPPRFFEAFLRGRSFREAPDITARICGICPVAYMTSAFNAMEDALGVEIDERIHVLRRLMYCGEWIESHALHVFLLHAPDFLGFESAWAMAREHREVVESGLKIKAMGNDLLRAIGGRAIHPINVRVGGFYKAPSQADLDALVPSLEEARELSRQSVAWVAGLEFPDFEQDYEFVALRHPERYAIEDGRLVSSSGLDIGPGEYEEHFTEEQVRHSTALQSRMSDGGTYFLGPMARYSLNSAQLSDVAREAAEEAGLGEECRNPFKSIVVRAVEILYAFDEALRLIADYEPPAPPAAEWSRRPRSGPAGARRRAGCSGIATGSRTTAPSRRRGSCLLPPRIRPESSRTCSSSCGPASTCQTIGCSGSASRRSATTTLASVARPTF